MKAAAGIAQDHDWRGALSQALTQLAALGSNGSAIDLAVLFASPHYAPAYSDLLAAVREALGPRVLIGCSGQGVIGPATEIEGESGLSLLALSVPGASLTPLTLTQAELSAGAFDRLPRADEVGGLLVLADPFSIDAELLIAVLSETYPDAPIIGGMASGDQAQRTTQLFLDGKVLGEGAVVLALGGSAAVCAVVSQGCTPIGKPWTITAAERQVIQMIGGRPALEVLMETLQELSPEVQDRARRNLLVGLAIDEYREEFERGDFLIRNPIGADRESGALAIGALPRVGQTLQFQLRDAEAADEDLRLLLEAQKANADGDEAAALLFSCNGRGAGLFGYPHHDARALAEVLGPLPVAGFFCNGEIGPVGTKTFLHGFTASIALLSARED